MPLPATLDSAGDVLSNGAYIEIRDRLLASLEKKKWKIDPGSVVEQSKLQGAREMLIRFHRMFVAVRNKQMKENIERTAEIKELDTYLY